MTRAAIAIAVGWLVFALTGENGRAQPSRESGSGEVQQDTAVTIVAGEDWIPLELELDIAPGTALDFSTLGLQDAPAGKHGWLKARADGTFFFQDQPDKPVRFYGVNFCFSAHYITHEQSDQVADRLAKLGYNAVRLHHYEGELTERQPDRTSLNPGKLDQLDYLVAACIRRGIYVSTDLFVSRPVDVLQFVPDVEGVRKDAMNSFKVLAALNPRAYENWKTFARNLLEHVNPHTQRAYKDEPGLAWLSLINEGNLNNFLQLAKDIPEYRQAWNRWLLDRYVDRAGLAVAWKSLAADEDPRRARSRWTGRFTARTCAAATPCCSWRRSTKTSWSVPPPSCARNWALRLC